MLIVLFLTIKSETLPGHTAVSDVCAVLSTLKCFLPEISVSFARRVWSHSVLEMSWVSYLSKAGPVITTVESNKRATADKCYSVPKREGRKPSCIPRKGKYRLSLSSIPTCSRREWSCSSQLEGTGMLECEFLISKIYFLLKNIFLQFMIMKRDEEITSGIYNRLKSLKLTTW